MHHIQFMNFGVTFHKQILSDMIHSHNCRIDSVQATLATAEATFAHDVEA